ncbi:hypothetical protein pipiens_006671 [Culex pipiens pipiens]|uniref:Uncharacterized protein n=1 Tax=Culex pipiens pipiens TaxID=38569 RepID=A0ABD1DNK6_CULPP
MPRPTNKRLQLVRATNQVKLGYISAALILAGVDSTRSYIYCINPHGSTLKRPYVMMGSGNLTDISVFESRWKPDMEEEEGKKLVWNCLTSYPK